MKHPILLLLCVVVFALLAVGCSQPAEEPVEEEASSEPPPPPKPKPGDYVTIPAGEFIMGSDQRPEKQENKPQLWEPEHKVNLPAYQISVYETTNAEFIKFLIESDYKAFGDWERFYTVGKEDFPVANVTYDDAKAYCEWAGGRLPTEQEWEKAARGADGNPFPWGDEFSATAANTNEAGFLNTVEVGQMSGDVSVYGVHDMFGNVTEWIGEKLAAYPASPARRDSSFRQGWYSTRGGSYAIRGNSAKLWSRGAYPAGAQYGVGFRCVKDVESAEGAGN